MKSERGSYRSIHTVLVDSPEYLALPANARLLLFVLKMKLGPIGIAVISGLWSALAESTGLTQQQATAALMELEGAGWVRVSGNMVWLVNGLRYEPGYSPKNQWHVQKINALLKALPRNPLVDAFRAYYADYLGIEASPEQEKELLLLVRKAPDEPKPKPEKKQPQTWVAEGVEWWTANVGTVNHGRFGTALKPLVDKYTWERVFPALQYYVTTANGQVRLEWFAANGVRLIEGSKQNAARKPQWQQEEEDAGMAKTPGVGDSVKAYMQTQNGGGAEWWEQMKAEAKQKGRHALVYAWEQIPK